MGDQQQKIEALRAAMTSIQERDPNEPVPDFLVVDTAAPPEPIVTEPARTEPALAEAAVAEPAAPDSAEPWWGAVPGSKFESEPDGPEFADVASEDLRFNASDEARPLVDPVEAPVRTARSTGEADAAGEVDPEDGQPHVGGTSEHDSGEHESHSGETAQLSPDEQYEKARAVVLRRLTGSPKSRHQLAVVLEEKEFSLDIITRVLDRMEEVHLVNDTEFARTWVKGRHELKNLGKSALRRELREKGISEDVAADALEQISAADEGAAARELVRRKLEGKTVPTGPSPEERAERDKVTRRLVSMLARRGHAPGSAFQIVREVIEDPSNA